ncbi:hypothetical protein ACROYT_G018221 [Oculina patagonica]
MTERAKHVGETSSFFSTHVGRSVFKSFKDEQPLLEEIARENGHEELACLLEQKHLIYRDDESESDDEVDWKALAKAIEKYQTPNGEMAEKKSIQSTSSSNGYLGDGESLSSLSSSQVSVAEGCLENIFEEQQITPEPKCREESITCKTRGSAASEERSLPPPTAPFVGRNSECEEIVANLTSSHSRIVNICGAQGIGKTAVAAQVGHILLSKDWYVHYHLYKDQDASFDFSGLLSAQAINEISHPTLFILDNMDMYNETDGQGNVFQSLVDSATKNGYVRLLFVTREKMHFLENTVLSFKLQPLSSTSAVELLNTTSRYITAVDLNAIAGVCGNIPHTLMVAKGLIEAGMSETDIINEILSSYKLRMYKGQELDDSHSSKAEKNLLVTSYSHPPHWPCRDYPIFAPKEEANLRKAHNSFDDGRSMPFYGDTEQAIYNVIERLDAPRELDFLLEPTDDLKRCLKIQECSKHPETAERERYGQKRKDTIALKSVVVPNVRSRQCSLEDVYFSSSKSALLPGVEQAVEPATEGENLLQKGQNPIAQTSKGSVSKVCVNEPPILAGVEQAVEPVTEGDHLLQKGQNPIAQTSKGSVSKVCVNEPPILAGVEQAVEPVTEGDHLLQKGQNPIAQTSEESVLEVCVNKPLSKSHSYRLAVPVEERYFEAAQTKRDSVCLSLMKTKCFVFGFLVTLLAVIGICAAIAVTLSANAKTTTTTTTTVPTTTTKTAAAIQACFNEPLTLHCETVTSPTAVYELQWKIKLPGTGWSEFSYCNKSRINCIVTRPMLPGGIKVLSNSNGTVTLERITKNNTNGHAQTLCEVHYSNNSVTSHIYEIKFTARCVWIQKGRDLNLTRILLSMLSCERVVDIEWYSINGSKFAYCNSCQGCKKTKSTYDNHLPVLWNRLQVARGSLLLTRIQDNDDGLTIRVEVHVKTSGKPAGKYLGINIESVRQYTIRILVNLSRDPAVETGKGILGEAGWESGYKTSGIFDGDDSTILPLLVATGTGTLGKAG